MVISQSTTSLQTLYRQAVEVSSDGKLYNIFFYWKVSMSYHSDINIKYLLSIDYLFWIVNTTRVQIMIIIIISIPVTVTVPLLLNIQQRWTDLHQDVMVMIWYLRIFDFQNHQKGMISMLNQKENLNSKIFQIPLFSPVTSAQKY